MPSDRHVQRRCISTTLAQPSAASSFGHGLTRFDACRFVSQIKQKGTLHGMVQHMMGSATAGWGFRASPGPGMGPQSVPQTQSNPELMPRIMAVQAGYAPVSGSSGGTSAQLYAAQPLFSATLDGTWDRPLLASAQSTSLAPPEQIQAQNGAQTMSLAGDPVGDSAADEQTRWGYRVKRLSSAMRRMGLLASDHQRHPSGAHFRI